MKLKTEHKVLFILALILINLLIVVRSFRLKIQSRYDQIISNPQIAQFIEQKDIKKLEDLTKQLGYDFQYVNNGKIVLQSVATLPAPNIINFRTSQSENVLEPTTNEVLKQLLPYVIWQDNKVYIVALVGTKLDSSDYYLIYSPLL